MRFTQQNVDTFARPNHKRKHVEWDDALPGFGLRIEGDSPAKYLAKVQIDYKSEIVIIGRIDRVKLDDARRIADSLLTVCAFAEQRIQKLKRKHLFGDDERIAPVEAPRIFQPTRILRFHELASVHGITYTRRHLRRLEDEGKFPNRVRISERLVGWVSTEIEEYLGEKLNERDEAISKK